MKKKTKRETQSEKKKKKIVEVSLKLFGAYGYNGTTISDISKASGFSTGSIYNFFGNKAGIMRDYIKEKHIKAGENRRKRGASWNRE